ncbi:MAG: hypothetical protein ACRD6I_14115 [Candidatus Acidiferrales bacterium]
MPSDDNQRAERARSATGDELLVLVHDAAGDVLAALVENPALNESHVVLLLERKDLPPPVLERVAQRSEWMRDYPVKLRVALHPRTPRLVALPLVRQLYLFDLARACLQPSAPTEVKRLAEEQILARLQQLALGQKLTLARRGPARVAGALLAEGHEQVAPLALENPHLTEAQLVRVLTRDDLPANVAAAVAQHRKWSLLYNVRIALVRNPGTPLARVLSFLPDLTMRDLSDLGGLTTLPANLREYLRHEIAARQARRPSRASGEE